MINKKEISAFATS